MAVSAAAVQSPDDWIAIADRELRNISGSYLGKVSNDARIDHALRATEAMLKAILWKHHKWPRWPHNQKGTKFLYRHDLQHLLDQCPEELRNALRLDREVYASWQTLKLGSLMQARYSPEAVSDSDANPIIKAARGYDYGVVPWLRKRYQQMI